MTFDAPLSLVILACLVYVIILVLLSLPLKIDASLSRYELTRRTRAGLATAAAVERWNNAVPILRVVRIIVVTFLAVTAINILLMTRSDALGMVTLVAIVAVPFSLLILSFGPFAALGSWVEKKLQQRLLGVAERSSPAVRHLLKRESGTNETAAVHSLDELMQVVDHSHELSRDEVSLVKNAVSFSRSTAAALMIPRPNIETVEATETLGPVVLTRMHQSGQDWFVVIDKKGNIDDPLGVLYLPGLRDVSAKAEIKTARVAMDRRIKRVEATTLLRDLLLEDAEVFIVVDTTDDSREPRTLGIVPATMVRTALLGANASA